MSRLLFTILIVCAGVSYASAQTSVFSQLDRDQYLAKVKLVDEFFARFNGEEVRTDIGSKYVDRASGILMLFDLSKYKSKGDSGFVAAEFFSKFAAGTEIKLNFEDKNWFAKIKCHGKLVQKNIVFDMFLCVEERDSAMYRWAICDVEGDLFQTSKDKPHKEFFIMPNDNEQFFQSVRKTTTETYKFIDDFVKQGYKADALSTFLALVRNKQLKIEAVTDVEFIFLQIPNYIFTVKHFERESKNAGWLIDSCKKTSEYEKSKLMRRLR